MADATTKKILRLLGEDQSIETRKAAVRVLSAIDADGDDVGAALCPCAESSDVGLRVLAIQALGKLKVQDGLPVLLARVREGGEGAEQAAQAAARLGAKAVKALHDLMPKVAPGLRRYIAAALGAGGSTSADHAALEFLRDSDPGVVEVTVRSLIAQVPELSPAKRKALTDALLDMLRAKGEELHPASEAAAVRLLAGLGDSRAEPLLWQRLTPHHPAELRMTALQALGKLGKSPGKDHAPALFACAKDRDFRIAAPALLILQNLPANDKNSDDWLGLLEAPDVAARRLALEKLQGRDTPKVAAALVEQMRHPDRSFREEVLRRLSELNHGRKALIDGLLDAATPDAAWDLARAQAPFAKNFSAPQRSRLFQHAAQHLDEGDRRAEAILFLLRAADGEDLAARLEERGLTLRKKKDYEKALPYFRQLARDPACGFNIRFELAGIGLKLSAKQLAHEARGNDPCLGTFSHLVQHYEAELTREIEKCKWLDPDDLYYLGFHFAEKEGVQKHFGGAMLKLAVKRSPKSKIGQAAKTKLKASGLS
jgi:HEAT repeat protein